MKLDEHGYLNKGVILVAVILVAAIYLSSVLSIWERYSSKREQAQLQADETLRFVKELVDHDAYSVIASMRTIGEVARHFVEMNHSLIDIAWDTPLTRTTIVIDSTGTIIADSRPGQPAMGRSVADREYFSVHSAHAESKVYIGPNVRSRVDGHWSLPFSIAVRDPKDGRVVVVVSSAVDPDAWGKLISERTRHLDLVLHLTDTEGVILTSAPFSEAVLGKGLSTVLSDSEIGLANTEGTFSRISNFLFPRSDLTRVATVSNLPIKVEIRTKSEKFAGEFFEYALSNVFVSLFLILVVLYYLFIQQKTNKKLQKSRAQLVESLQASSEGFALFDAQGRLVISNSVFRGFYETESYKIKVGMTLKDMLRAWLADGAYPAATGMEEKWIEQRLKQHFEGGTSIQQLADGRWLQVSDRRTADGGVVSVRTDITELKTQERDLRQSKRRFEDFAKTASDWMWETDVENRVVEFGHSEDLATIIDLNDVLGKRRDQFAIGRKDTEDWRAHFRDLDQRKPFRNFQYWTKANRSQSEDGEGENHLVSISGVPVFDEDGTFVGYRGTGRDLTKEYQDSQKIKATEAKFRTMFESIRVGVVLTDEQGEIVAFNPAASAIFGYEADEIVGRNVSVLADEEHQRQHDSYIRNYLQTGDAKLIGKNRELPAVRKNGDVFPIKLAVAEMSLSGKTQFIASIVDISAEKGLEAQLRQSQKLEAVGLMVGGIAHDFNNILGIIIGHLDLASKKVEPGSKLEGQISKSLHAANRGASLTRRLLSFSRKSAVKTDRVDVNTALSGLYDLIQKSLTENIHVQMSLDCEDPLAFVNAGDFEDAIINLCLNSRDALPNGGEITIRSDLRRLSKEDLLALGLPEKDYVIVSVSDNGEGIPDDAKDKIFEPFYTTKETGKGSGLGLSMVYSFVKRSRGHIEIESEVGTGTRVSMLLPCPEAEDGVEDHPFTASDVERETPCGTESILIVDDETDLAEVAEQYLSDLGYSTQVAHGYSEAVSLLQNGGTFDLLFSDVVMPGGQDGFQLADKARTLMPNIQICLVSGYSGSGFSDEDVQEAVYPLLKKPYTKQDVGSAIRRILDER